MLCHLADLLDADGPHELAAHRRHEGGVRALSRREGGESLRNRVVTRHEPPGVVEARLGPSSKLAPCVADLGVGKERRSYRALVPGDTAVHAPGVAGAGTAGYGAVGVEKVEPADERHPVDGGAASRAGVIATLLKVALEAAFDSGTPRSIAGGDENRSKSTSAGRLDSASCIEFSLSPV